MCISPDGKIASAGANLFHRNSCGKRHWAISYLPAVFRDTHPAMVGSNLVFRREGKWGTSEISFHHVYLPYEYFYAYQITTARAGTNISPPVLLLGPPQ